MTNKSKNKLQRIPPRIKPQADMLAQAGQWRDALPDSSSARGYTYQWQQARLEHLAASPLCVMCRARGRVTLATIVDHVIPHRGDMALFWNRDNWQSLCKPCHDGDKQRQERNAP